MRANATQMQAAVDYVSAHPGVPRRVLIGHLFENETRLIEALSSPLKDDERRKRLFKRVASVVDRVLRDRLVRQDAALRLFPWDMKRKAFAEALERAAFAAPDRTRFESTLALACEAWRHAGDEARALTLSRLETTKLGDTQGIESGAG